MVVPTHLKNISQIGSFPRGEKKCLKPPPSFSADFIKNSRDYSALMVKVLDFQGQDVQHLSVGCSWRLKSQPLDPQKPMEKWRFQPAKNMGKITPNIWRKPGFPWHQLNNTNIRVFDDPNFGNRFTPSVKKHFEPKIFATHYHTTSR